MTDYLKLMDQIDAGTSYAAPTTTQPANPNAASYYLDQMNQIDGVQPSSQSQGQREDTTIAGLEGAAARGVAPYAVGATLGAAMGAPFAGVGAIPGAVAGATAVGLTDLAANAYNPVARHFGLTPLPTASQAVNYLLDKVGVEKPQTSAERITQALTGGGASAITGAALANQIAETASNPVTQNIAETLASRPLLQGTSGALQGASAQGTSEAGYGPSAQRVAALVGGSLPYGIAALPRLAYAEPTAQAVEAHNQGYVIPPGSASEKPSILTQVAQALPGKTSLAQAASMKNSGITEQLAAKALGLPEDTQLTDQVFNQVRTNAGKAYAAIEGAVPVIQPNSNFLDTVSNLGSQNSPAAAAFPKIMKNAEVADLVDELKNVQPFSPRAGLETIKQLRAEANSNFQAIGDPKRQSLALVQRQAADALDKLIEDNITEYQANPVSGRQIPTDLVDNYRAARQLIAKSYDLQSVTNPATGEVNAIGLARLAAKGRPLSGELKTIADTAAAFPKVMQSPTAFGSNVPTLSPVDIAGAGGLAISGHPAAALGFLARPVARATILSGPYQSWMMQPSGLGSPLPFLGLPGMSQTQDPRAALAGILSGQNVNAH